MSSEDTTWDDMLQIAILQQQEYYELIPEWTEYKKSEYKYLKQNIAFAMFGPPLENQESSNVLQNNFDISEIHYKREQQKSICNMYKVICKVAKEGNVKGCRCKRTDTESIYYSLIYNATVYSENNFKVFKKKGEKPNLSFYPIFKVKQHVYDEKKKKCFNQILYIDTWTRVYTDWEHYKTTNILPQCIMILPKDGFYQPDLSYEITEEYSRVWLESVKSPACNTAAAACSVVDTFSTVLNVTGLAVGAASLVTPVAPVVMSGVAIVSGLSGAWGIGRSTSNLIDRSTHKQSINPLDRSALDSWLCISGSVLGITLHGSNVLLTKLIKNGKDIGLITRVAFNSLIIGNLTVNGAGVAYQAFSMYEKYRLGEKIDLIDVVMLSTSILFFGNTIINQQFAGDLIKTTQGKILEDYRNSLRSKNLRKKFNRVKRKAATNNSNKVSENAEVISYINKKADLINKSDNTLISVTNLIEKGKMKFCGITLLDPVMFVKIFINSKCEQTMNVDDESDSNEKMFITLKHLLLALLKEYNNSAGTFNITSYSEILKEMKCIKNAENVLLLIFKMGYFITRKCSSFSDFLTEAIYFVWYYVKTCLKETVANAINMLARDREVQKVLNKLITSLYMGMDEMEERFLLAFKEYLRTVKTVNM